MNTRPKKLPSRLTTSFDPQTAAAIRAWGNASNLPSLSETLRVLVVHALAKPPDAAFLAAYQQVRSELGAVAAQAARRILAELDAEVSKTVGRGRRM